MESVSAAGWKPRKRETLSERHLPFAGGVAPLPLLARCSFFAFCGRRLLFLLLGGGGRFGGADAVRTEGSNILVLPGVDGLAQVLDVRRTL